MGGQRDSIFASVITAKEGKLRIPTMFYYPDRMKFHETVARDPDIPPGMQDYSLVRTEMEVERPPPRMYRPSKREEAERDSHQSTPITIQTMPRRNLSDQETSMETKRNIKLIKSQYSKNTFWKTV